MLLFVKKQLPLYGFPSAGLLAVRMFFGYVNVLNDLHGLEVWSDMTVIVLFGLLIYIPLPHKLVDILFTASVITSLLHHLFK